MSERSSWRQKRVWVGFVACCILILVGLVFVIAGLAFCRSAIECPLGEFRYSFVPLFVLVSIGLILMLGGSMGMMHIEIASHDEEVIGAIRIIKDDLSKLLDQKGADPPEERDKGEEEKEGET